MMLRKVQCFNFQLFAGNYLITYKANQLLWNCQVHAVENFSNRNRFKFRFSIVWVIFWQIIKFILSNLNRVDYSTLF